MQLCRRRLPYAYVLYIIQNAKAINQATDAYDENAWCDGSSPYGAVYARSAGCVFPFYLQHVTRARCQATVDWRRLTDLANIVSTGHIWSPSGDRRELSFVKNDAITRGRGADIDQQPSIIADQNTEVALYESGASTWRRRARSLPIEELTHPQMRR